MRNIYTFPFLGTAGFIAAPLKGMMFSSAKLFQKQRPQVQRVNRIIDGLKESKECTAEERQKIIDIFSIAKETEEERIATYTMLASEALNEIQEDLDNPMVTTPSRTRTTSNSSTQVNVRQPTISSAPTPSVALEDDDTEDVQFLRNVERAKQLSLQDL